MMDAGHQHKPISDLKEIDGAQWISPAFIQGIIIEEMHERKGIEATDLVVVRVSLDGHEPQDLQDLGDQEDEFGANDHTPALGICYAVSVHETAYPDDEGDHREFPQIHKGN